MFKLIRDNIPKIVQEKNEVIDFATVENDEFFYQLLLSKLSEEVNEFFISDDVTELVDILTVIKKIVECKKLTEEEFTELYNLKEKTNGEINILCFGLILQASPKQLKIFSTFLFVFCCFVLTFSWFRYTMYVLKNLNL